MAVVSSFWRRWTTVVGLILLGCGSTSGTDANDGEQVGDASQATTSQQCASPALAGECRYQPTQATASSVESNNSSYVAAKAIDGDCTTRWSSAASDPQWLRLDLGSSRPLSRLIIHWENAASSNYQIQASNDASNWTTIATKANATITGTGSARVDTIAGLTASARYVRLYSLARTTSYGNSAFELEVFGTDCATSCSQIPVQVASATASSVEQTTLAASNAIDGKSSTRWGSAFSDPQWLKLDLGGSISVGRVAIDWENASSAQYDLQMSEGADGPWTVVQSRSSTQSGARTDDISGLDAKGRYLRIYSTKRTSSYGNSIFEVRVFKKSCDRCEQVLPAASATASSLESSAFPAAKAIDGDYGTRWSSQFSDPQWLSVDYGSTRVFTEVIVKWESSGASKSYRLEVSNSASGPWTSIAERSNLPSGPRSDDIAGLNASGRFLRVFSTARTSQYGNSIYELIALGAADGKACSRRHCVEGNGVTCGGPRAASGVTTFTLSVPLGVNHTDVAFGATDAVSIGSAARVISGGATDKSLVTSAAGTITLGPNSRTSGLSAIGDVTLQSGSVASGNAASQGNVLIGQNAAVSGQVSSHATLTPLNVLSWTVFMPALDRGLGDFVLQSGREKILFPQTYGDLSVASGAKVFLRSGTYFFKNVNFAAGSQLVLDTQGGFATVYIDGSFSWSGTMSGLGGERARLLIGYSGTQPVTLAGSFHGLLVAPSAAVNLTGTGAFQGSIFGKSVSLADGASFTHEPSPWTFVSGAPLPNAQPRPLGKTPVTLNARNDHVPESVTPGTSTPALPTQFTIPSRIPVSSGNAGNATATLTYTQTNNTVVTCTYRGGASSLSPTDLLEIAKGREYVFVSCSNGVAAGTKVVGTNFSLTVHGDPNGLGQSTNARLSLGGGCNQELGQPISPADSIAMVQGFSWQNTQPLVETTAEGLPTLYYANIYIRNLQELALLSTFRIHYEKRPIFDSEMVPFMGKCGTFSYAGDGQGLFVFAVIPGKTYNRIRAAFFNGEIPANERELFKAIILRQAPAAAVDANGALLYSVLKEAGFQYLGVRALPSDAALDEIQMPLSGAVSAVVHAVEFVATVANEVAQTVTVVLGAIDRFLSGSVTQTVDLEVLNVDPRFTGSITRAWGPGAGVRISPHGAKVELLQWAQRLYTLGAPLPTKFTGTLDSNGRVGIEVAKSGDGFLGGSTSPRGSSGMCIELANPAARVTSFLLADELCDLPVIDPAHPDSQQSAFDYTKDTTVVVSTNNADMVALTEITDSYDFYTSVIGGRYINPRVLRGFNATVLSAGGTTLWTPCFGRRNAVVDLATLLSLGIAGPLAATYVSIVGTSDYVIPQNSHLEDARGIMTHESGHYAFCNLIPDDAELDFFSNLTIKTIFEGKDFGPTDPARVINESFADFFTGEVASGNNYFSLTGQNDGTVRPYTHFCLAQGTCWDANVVSPEDATDDRLEKLATTIHDAFDGNGKGMLSPTDGDAWMLSAGKIVATSSAYGDDHDEVVQLGGPKIATFVDNFVNHGNGLDIVEFERALANTAYAENNWCDLCQMFANHETGLDGAAATTQWAACRGDARLFRVLGPPPDLDLRMDASTCEVCTNPRAISNASGACVECPVGQIQTNNVCTACPGGTIQVNNTCQACPANAVSSNNGCVACAADQIADHATNSCVTCPADVVFDMPTLRQLQGTEFGTITSRQSTSHAPNDACPDEFWLQLEGISPTMDDISVKVATEALISKAACPATSVIASSFEQFTTSWLEKQAVGGFGAACTGTICPADCFWGGALNREAEMIIHPPNVHGSIVRVRIAGRRGTTVEPVLSIVTFPTDSGGPL